MIVPRSRRVLGAALLSLAAAWGGRASAEAAPADVAGPAQARPPAPSAPAAQGLAAAQRGDRGPFALLLELGPYSGFGAGVAVGTGAVGVRASVGWSPVLVLLTGSNPGLELYSGLQVSPDLYVRIFHPRPKMHIGFQGGYRYSSLLGHGGAAGAYFQFAIGGAVDGIAAGGFVFYPDGEDHLKKEQNLSSATSFSFPGPSVNFGLSFGLAFFP